MSLKINIQLLLPEATRPNRYFTIRLQPKIQKQSSTYPIAPALFVVSDLHGKFHSFYTLLIANKIIDKHFRWTFEDGQLVILGNHYEKEEFTPECLWFIYSLEQKAISKGGCVHFILGSHEIVQMNGKWTSHHPSYAPPDAKTREPVAAFYNANLELRKWIGTRNVVEKIGNLLFVHGTNLTSLLLGGSDIAGTNEIARSNYNSTRPAKLPTAPFAVMDITEKQLLSILKNFDAKKLITTYKTQETDISLFGGKLINLSNLQLNNELKGIFIE